MAISSISTLYLAGAPSLIAPPQLLRAHRPSSLQLRRRSLAIAASAAENSPKSLRPSAPGRERVHFHVYFCYLLLQTLNDLSVGYIGDMFINECMLVDIDSGKLDQLQRCFEAAAESEEQSNKLSLPDHRFLRAAVLFFNRPRQELDALSVRELVDLIINACMYAGIDRGKLDLLRRCFEEGGETIEYCVNRLRTANRGKAKEMEIESFEIEGEHIIFDLDAYSQPSPRTESTEWGN